MRFFVLPIFDGVIMDGHPIFGWWMPAYLVGIVLFLHFIGVIYLSKICLHHFIGFI